MNTQLLLHYLTTKSLNICMESNPIRQGWELHKQNTLTKIKDNPEWYDKYYLIECYTETLSENELNTLYGYVDGLAQKVFFDWLKGHCSLAHSLEYTFDKWNDIFVRDLKEIRSAAKKRAIFIKANK